MNTELISGSTGAGLLRRAAFVGFALAAGVSYVGNGCSSPTKIQDESLPQENPRDVPELLTASARVPTDTVQLEGNTLTARSHSQEIPVATPGPIPKTETAISTSGAGTLPMLIAARQENKDLRQRNDFLQRKIAENEAAMAQFLREYSSDTTSFAQRIAAVEHRGAAAVTSGSTIITTLQEVQDKQLQKMTGIELALDGYSKIVERRSAESATATAGLARVYTALDAKTYENTAAIDQLRAQIVDPNQVLELIRDERKTQGLPENQEALELYFNERIAPFIAVARRLNPLTDITIAALEDPKAKYVDVRRAVLEHAEGIPPLIQKVNDLDATTAELKHRTDTIPAYKTLTPVPASLPAPVTPAASSASSTSVTHTLPGESYDALVKEARAAYFKSTINEEKYHNLLRGVNEGQSADALRRAYLTPEVK